MRAKHTISRTGRVGNRVLRSIILLGRSLMGQQHRFNDVRGSSRYRHSCLADTTRTMISLRWRCEKFSCSRMIVVEAAKQRASRGSGAGNLAGEPCLLRDATNFDIAMAPYGKF
jgi:hypothetical protein